MSTTTIHLCYETKKCKRTHLGLSVEIFNLLKEGSVDAMPEGVLVFHKLL